MWTGWGRPVRKDGPCVVAEQARAQGTLRRRQRRVNQLSAEHVSLNDEDIEVAVVVEVEQRDAGRHDFRVVEVAGHAVEVREGETGLFRPIDEPFHRFIDDGGFLGGLAPDQTRKNAVHKKGPRVHAALMLSDVVSGFSRTSIARHRELALLASLGP